MPVSAPDEAQEEACCHSELPASHFVQGLANPQHACFFNAMAQFLASSAHLNAPEFTSQLEQLPRVGPSLAAVLDGINTFDAEEQPYSAIHLLCHIARKNAALNGQTEQDSHEALMQLLELIDDEMQKRAAKGRKQSGGYGAICTHRDTRHTSPYVTCDFHRFSPTLHRLTRSRPDTESK